MFNYCQHPHLFVSEEALTSNPPSQGGNLSPGLFYKGRDLRSGIKILIRCAGAVDYYRYCSQCDSYTEPRGGEGGAEEAEESRRSKILDSQESLSRLRNQ